MSHFLNQIKRASLNEAADLLASKYVETAGNRSGFPKSAEIGSASLYGAAAGAGVGGLGTLGLDYLTGKGVNSRRALYGALIGAVPGAAAGALADTYGTPAVKDQKDPPSSPSLTVGKAWNFVNPFKLPSDFSEAGSGAAGASVGWWGGSKLNNILPKSWGAFNSGSGELFDPNGRLGWLNTNNIKNKAMVEGLNADHGTAFKGLRDSQVFLDNSKADLVRAESDLVRAGAARRGLGGRDLVNANKAYRAAQDAHSAAEGARDAAQANVTIANSALQDVGANRPEIVRRPGMFNRPTQGIYEKPGTPGNTSIDPEKYRHVASGRSYILPAIGALFGYGSGISLDRAISKPLSDLFSRSEKDDVD